MDPFKNITEHRISIQDEIHQETKITKEQEIILFQLYLADVLLFGAWTLDSEQQKLQDTLCEEYLCSLKPWDTVEIWLSGMFPYHPWTVVANDGHMVKIKASCYLNKRKKEGIRSFSITDWLSSWFIMHRDDRDDETKIQRFFIVIPASHTVKSTRWIPQEALDEIHEIYKQAGDPTTCYDLVNTLKHWSPQDKEDTMTDNLISTRLKDKKDDLPF